MNNMKKIKLEVEFTYDTKIMHGKDKEAIDWFYNDILLSEKLTLHSDEIGDEIGTIKVLKIKTTKAK